MYVAGPVGNHRYTVRWCDSFFSLAWGSGRPSFEIFFKSTFGNILGMYPKLLDAYKLAEPSSGSSIVLLSLDS